MRTVQCFLLPGFPPSPLVLACSHSWSKQSNSKKKINKETHDTEKLSLAVSFELRFQRFTAAPIFVWFHGCGYVLRMWKKIRHALVPAVPECKTRISQRPINQPLALLQRCSPFSKALARTEGPTICQCLYGAAEAERWWTLEAERVLKFNWKWRCNFSEMISCHRAPNLKCENTILFTDTESACLPPTLPLFHPTAANSSSSMVRPLPLQLKTPQFRWDKLLQAHFTPQLMWARSLILS